MGTQLLLGHRQHFRSLSTTHEAALILHDDLHLMLCESTSKRICERGREGCRQCLHDEPCLKQIHTHQRTMPGLNVGLVMIKACHVAGGDSICIYSFGNLATRLVRLIHIAQMETPIVVGQTTRRTAWRLNNNVSPAE